MKLSLADTTRRPSQGRGRYCVMVGNACQYEVNNSELDDGEPEKAVLVGRTYLGMHAAVVRERIAMAGVRLAGLLNRALGAPPPDW